MTFRMNNANLKLFGRSSAEGVSRSMEVKAERGVLVQYNSDTQCGQQQESGEQQASLPPCHFCGTGNSPIHQFIGAW